MAKRKRGINRIFATIFLLLFTIACIGGGFLFVRNAKRSFLEAEKEMPESGISTYLNKIRTNDLDGVYEDSLKITPHLNSKEDYIEQLKKIYEKVDVSKLTFVPAEEEEMYYLVLDNELISTVKLEKAEDGSWLASTIFGGDNQYYVEVPVGLTISVNGRELDEVYLEEKNVVASNFKGLKDSSRAPKVNRYRLDNLISKPEIEVVGESGYTTLDDILSNTIFVGKDAQTQENANTFIDDITICAKFPAQETGLGAVSAISITNSDWYQRIRSLQNTWFTSHGTSSFTNQSARNIIQQSDDTMVGYVTFDYYASNGEVSRTWNSGFQVSFLKENGVWKIAGMGVDSRLNPAVE